MKRKAQRQNFYVVRGRPEMTSSFGGRGGVGQMMTVDDRGEGGSKPNYDAMK